MNLSDLKAPFAPDKVSWRVGSTTADKSKGMALAYIDARDVQDRLDEVCGVMGWQSRYVPMHDKKTVCEIGIYSEFHQAWIWKSDGAGDSDIEAEKGALSDAFKRAAVRWGVGRYLYDLDSPWVELDTYEKQGKVFAKGIKASERKRLEAILAKGAGTPTTAPTKPQEVHNHVTPGTAANKPDLVPDEDPDGQVKNWCDKEIAKWKDLTRLPDMLMWQDEREPEISRLLRKSPLMHRYLMDRYEAKKDEILKVSK